MDPKKKKPPAQAPEQEPTERSVTVQVHYQDADGNAQTVDVDRGAARAYVSGGVLTLNWGGDGLLLSSTFAVPEATLGASTEPPTEPEEKVLPPTGRFLVMDISGLTDAESREVTMQVIGLGAPASVLAVVGGEMPSKARDMGALMMLLERLAPLATERLRAVIGALGAKLGTGHELTLSDGRVVTGQKTVGGKARHPWTVVPARQRSMLPDDE